MKKISCMVTVGTLLCLATPSVIASEQQAPSTPETIETVEDTKPIEVVEDTKPVDEGDATNQEQQKGFVTIHNQQYYFADNGDKVIGFYTIPQTTDMIYTNSEGIVQTGWIQVGEDTYYADPITNFLKKSEWFNQAKTKNWFYFKEDGTLARNTIVNDSFVDDEGKMVRNQWVFAPQSGHYFAKENGKLAHNEWVNGSYLKENGKMAQNEWVEYNGHWYFITPNSVYAHDTWKGEYYLKQYGDMAKDEWIYDNNSHNWYFINSDGRYARNQWIGAYYLNQWGDMAQSEWINDNGKWYYAKTDGSYAWQEWMGNYYFNYWGDMAQNQWIDYNNNWYYAKADGQYAWNEWKGNYYFNYWGDMAQNEWIYDNGKWYYAKADGQYAWQEWKGNYYFNYWGDMAKSKRDIPRNSWFKENSYWYYMTSTGTLKKGWLNVGNAWYYMNSTGAMETNQWVGNYYVGSDGKMLKNTTTPDGYLVDYEGQWIPAKPQPEYKPEPKPQPKPEEPTIQQKPVETNDNNEPVKSLEEMEEYVNTHINKQHINDEFIKLLNEERKAHGITTVTYSPILFKGADIRSKELEINYSHTRPNGEICYTVFPKEERNKFRTILENAGSVALPFNFKETLEQLEIETAKKMFNGWKNSPKHYDNMMVNGDLQVALSAHFRVTSFYTDHYSIRVYSSLFIAGNASY